MKPRRNHTKPILAACLLTAAFPLAASADTLNYIGLDNSQFNSTGSWDTGNKPVNGDTVSIGVKSIAGLTSGNLDVTYNYIVTSLNSITFDSTALPGAYIITETGGTLGVNTETFNGANAGNVYNLTQGSANTAVTLNIASASNAHVAYNVSGTGTTLTVTSNLWIGVDGTGVLTQSDGIVNVINTTTGNSTLILGADSGATGTYNLTNGSLTVNDFQFAGGGNGIFNQSGGSLTINAVAFFDADSGQTATYNYSGGTASFTNGLTVGSSGIFNLKTGGALPFNLTVAAGGTFNLAGGTFGTGNVTLSGGTFQLQGHNLTFSSHIQGTGTLQNGSTTTATTLTLSATGSFAGNIADGSTATMSVSLTTGTFTLSGSNTYSGGTTIMFPGTLKAGSTNAFSPNSIISFSGNGILDLNGFDQTIGGLSGFSGSLNIGSNTLTVAQSSTTSFQNPLNGTGNFIKSSAGTLNLSDVFAYTGGFSATGGTLAISNTISASAYSASNGGILQLAFPVTLTTGTMNATGGAITFTSSNAPTIGDTSGSPATVTIGAAGTFTTGTGATDINATGAINLSGGTFNANGGITLTGGSFTQTSGTFTWAPNQTMTIQSSGTVSLVNGYTTPAGATITVTGSGSKLSQTTNALQINNGATLNVNSAATVFTNIFTVASIYNSATSGTGNGTVTVDGANSSLVGNFSQCYIGIGGVGNLTFSGGATGSFFGFFIGTFMTAGDNGTLNVQSSATVTSNSVIRVAAAITAGTGAINVTGGTLTQTGTNVVFIGAASASTGTVTIGSAGTFTTGSGLITIGKTGTLNLQSGGTFNINGNLTNSGNVTLSGTQTWAASTTFTNSAGIAIFNTDAGSSSASPLSLALNAGTVILNGTQHLHSLTINGGTLGGYANISVPLTLGTSAYTIAPSATLPPTSTGNLTLTALTTNTHTTLAFNLLTPKTASASSINDTITLPTANSLTINGGNLQITGNNTGLSSLGFYKAIQYNGNIQGAGITSILLPPIQNNIVYTLDTAKDPGYVDIHRGFLGDANDDGLVNFADFIQLSDNFGASNAGWAGGDFNGDGIVNFADFIILSDNFGESVTGADLTANEIAQFQSETADFAPPTPVPEPASLLLLAIPTLTLLTRRKIGRSV